jgi:hypothetical protein
MLPRSFRVPPLRALRALVLCCTTALALVACGGDGDTSAPAELPADPSPQQTDFFLRPASPQAVSPVLDAARAVTQRVGPGGGMVVATGADGSRYTLVLPPDALLVDTAITMTPLAAVSGMPFERMAGGVDLAPDGLRLYAFAQLMIEPASAPPASKQVLFGYGGAGQELRMLAPAAGASTTLLLDHFSGYGVALAEPAQVQAQRLHLPSEGVERLRQEVAALLADSRDRELNGLPPNPELDSAIRALFVAMMDQVLRPMLALPAGSCAEGRSRIEQVISAQRQAILLLGEEDPITLALLELDVLTGPEGIAHVRLCMDESYKRCVEHHDVGAVWMTMLDANRVWQLLADGIPPWLEQAERLVRQCATFRLEVDSLIVANWGDGMRMQHSVSARVPLLLDGLLGNPNAVRIRGSAPLVPGTHVFTPTTDAECGIVPKAPVVHGPVQATLEFQWALGISTDAILDLGVPQITIPADWNCEGATFSRELATWSPAFVVLHADECSGAGCYRVQNWQMSPDFILARKSYQRRVTVDDVDYDETTLFTIKHVPGE